MLPLRQGPLVWLSLRNRRAKSKNSDLSAGDLNPLSRANTSPLSVSNSIPPLASVILVTEVQS